MDFNQVDIRRFLIGAMPGRFNLISPADFENFVAYLFKVDGYEVETISSKSDLTANLLATKEDTTLVIRVMRFPAEQVIGIPAIHQAMAAMDFYKTDQSWIITTSGFTDEAKTLAENAEIELWDWQALERALNELFFEGRNYTEFMEPTLEGSNKTDFDPPIKLKVKWEAREGVGAKWYNLSLTLTNHSDENVYIHLDLPVLVDKEKNQVSADQWLEEEFVAGILYAGASVRTCALFKTSKLGERPPGGKIMVTCHQRNPQVSYHLASKLKGEACYFVAYCYTRESPEYMMMTKFRDDVLYKIMPGRIFIKTYYSISPALLRVAPQYWWLHNLIRRFTLFATSKVKKYYLNQKGISQESR